ncbi:hypothetical protein VDG1235_3839 [Verrucomicrobiia bacterium DG1235]|nr:hypothetical protein VDG1235_3839 [Verrucomicrobiae bacterium DG1235]
MNDYTIEHLPEINSLLVRLHGDIEADSIIEIYSKVLDHKRFKTNTNIIWNALSASITGLSIADLKKAFNSVKKTETRRGRSCSAWILSRGENYEAACLFKAAFASGLKIRYEVFNNVNEAKDWVQAIESRRIRDNSAI